MRYCSKGVRIGGKIFIFFTIDVYKKKKYCKYLNLDHDEIFFIYLFSSCCWPRVDFVKCEFPSHIVSVGFQKFLFFSRVTLPTYKSRRARPHHGSLRRTQSFPGIGHVVINRPADRASREPLDCSMCRWTILLFWSHSLNSNNIFHVHGG